MEFIVIGRREVLIEQPVVLQGRYNGLHVHSIEYEMWLVISLSILLFRVRVFEFRGLVV